MTEKILKLSEMPDDIEVGREGVNCKYTVAELKREIIELGEPHHEYSDWYTVKNQRWQPDAEGMIENYIESQRDDMYEDWDERAYDCLDDEVKARIQAILDEAFSGGYATEYWTFEQPVEIDIRVD